MRLCFYLLIQYTVFAHYMCYTYELAFGIHTNFVIIIIKAQSAIVPFKHRREGIALLRQHIVPLCLTVPYPMFIRRSVSRIACI